MLAYFTYFLILEKQRPELKKWVIIKSMRKLSEYWVWEQRIRRKSVLTVALY